MSQVVADLRSSDGGVAKLAHPFWATFFSVLLAIASLPQLLGAKIVDGLNLFGIQFVSNESFRAFGGDARYWIYLAALLPFLLAWRGLVRKAPSERTLGLYVAANCGIGALVLLSVSYATPDFLARFTGLSALPFVAFAFLLIPLVWLWETDARGKHMLIATTFYSSAVLSVIIYVLVDVRPSPGSLSTSVYLLQEGCIAAAVVAGVTTYNVFVRKPAYREGWTSALVALGFSIVAATLISAVFLSA